MKKLILIVLAIMSVTLLTAQTRLKDISKVSGADSKQLIGYGLVVGLQGTGDTPASQATIQSINNMLGNFGLNVNENRIRPNNVAAVMVTAVMPPFAGPGTNFDVLVSSVADARSLEGGTLLMTPLIGQDNKKYAIAQGAISIGGSNEDTKGNNRVRRNYANAGRISNGANVEVENPGMLLKDGEIKIYLNQPDFSTAEKVVNAINALNNGGNIATAANASNINVTVPDNIIMNNSLVSFISTIENLNIEPEQAARVVINERTGTIIAGANVRISEVSIAHGNLIVKVPKELNLGPYSLEMLLEGNRGRESAQLFNFQAGTVGELANALNAIKVTPRDLIAIFQALKEAGALNADLRIL